MALKEAMRAPKKPPNLRTGTARARCELCRHFNDGTCRLYNYSVRANDTCDSFSAAAQTPNGR